MIAPPSAMQVRGGVAWRIFKQVTGWNLSRAAFYRMLKRGELKGTRLARPKSAVWLVSLQDIVAYWRDHAA